MTMLVTSYETFADRTVDLVSEEDSSNPAKSVAMWRSRYADVFDFVLLDEGHKIRHR